MNRGGLRIGKHSKLQLKKNAGTKSTTEISKFFSKDTITPETSSLLQIASTITPTSSQKRKQHQNENNNTSPPVDDSEHIPTKRKTAIKAHHSQPCTSEISKFFQQQSDSSSSVVSKKNAKKLSAKPSPRSSIAKFTKPTRSKLDIRNSMKHIDLKKQLLSYLNEENDQVDLDHFVDDKKSDNIDRKSCDNNDRKSCEDFQIFSVPAVGRGKRKKWLNVNTTLTRRNHAKQEAKQNRMIQSILHINAAESQDIIYDELMGPSLLMSQYLVRFYFPESNIYRKNGIQNELSIDDFYAGDLCDKTINKCGCLLKNWSKIPGRCPTPEPQQEIVMSNVVAENKDALQTNDSSNVNTENHLPLETDIEVNSSPKNSSSISIEICDADPEIERCSRESSPDMFADFESDHSNTSDHISTTNPKTECFNNFDEKSFEIIQNYSKLLEKEQDDNMHDGSSMSVDNDEQIQELTNKNQSMLLCDINTIHSSNLNNNATETTSTSCSETSSNSQSPIEELCVQESPEVLDEDSTSSVKNIKECEIPFGNEYENDNINRISQSSTKSISNDIKACTSIKPTLQEPIIILDSDSDSNKSRPNSPNAFSIFTPKRSKSESPPYSNDYIDKLLENSILASPLASESNEDLHKIFDETMTQFSSPNRNDDELNMINESVGHLFDISSPNLSSKSKNTLRKTASDISMMPMKSNEKNAKFSEFLDITITASPTTNCNENSDDEIDALVNEYSFTQPERKCSNSIEFDFCDKIDEFPATQQISCSMPNESCNEFEVLHKHQTFAIKCGNNVSPKPDYDRMDTPTRAIHLKKYGLKPLKRHKAIICLEHIYNRLHPFIGIDFNYSATQSLAKKTDSVEMLCSTDLSQNRLSGVNKLLENEDEMSEFNNENQTIFLPSAPRSKKPWCLQPLHIAWYNLLISNKRLHEMVLQYHPFDLNEIKKHFKELGLIYNINDLKTFFDRQCITFQVDNNRNMKK